MHPRPNTRLHDLLNQQIYFYETTENPVPETKWQKFAAMFRHSGATGRSRADSYSFKVNAVQDEATLLKMVLNDVLGKGVGLKGSTVLKRDIYQALCKYYNVNLSRIDEEVQEVMNAAAFSLAYIDSGYIPDADLMREGKMHNAIARAANWPTTLNQKAIKQVKSHTALHDLVNERIDYYQTEDNKKPKTALQTIGSFFRHCGLTGRKRAATYKVEANAIADEQTLLNKLLEDTLGNGFDLRGSTVLKRRMLEALCSHYKIDMQDVKEKTNYCVQATIRGYARAGVGVPIDIEAVHDTKMQEAILKASHWKPAANLQMRVSHT